MSIPVSLVWCERYPHLYLQTEQDIRNAWRDIDADETDEVIARKKFIEVPQEVVTNYRLAMKLLEEVEQQVTNIQKENK